MKTKLEKHNKNKQIVKKHVSAIHIDAKLSLLQRKLVNALLYNAYDQLLTAKDHKISSALLCEMIGFDSNNTAYLKRALKGLMETVVEFDVLEDDGKWSWEAISLMSFARLRDGVCTYRYDPGMAEKLYHPDVYAKINLNVLREMKSSYALILYENCYRYVDIAHTPWWDVDVFRKLMSVDDLASYKQFKLLNRAIIQPAMKEVNEVSNIQLELETRRRGRLVTGLRFIISQNPQLSLVGMEEEDDITQSAAYGALIAEGISKTLARAWVLEHDEEYIFEKLDLANNNAATGKIKSSKAGFLKSAIEQDYHSEHAAKKKQVEVAQGKKLQREQKQAKLDGVKAALREAESLYRRVCVEMIENAFQDLTQGKQDAAMKEFQLSLGSHVYVSAFKSNGWKDRLNFLDIKRYWEGRGLQLPSPAEVAQKNSSQEPDALRKQIEAMEAELKKIS